MPPARDHLRLVTPATAPDDSALVRRCAQGDSTALAELYDRTAPQIHGLVLRILGDHAAAEEVTGDVYLQAWRQAERWDPTRGRPLAWLLTMARSRAIDRVRSRGRARLEVRDDLASVRTRAADSASPEESVIAADHRQRVATALGKLSLDERQAIELAFFDGLSHSEIAARLQTPLGTVKTRIRLGMLRLRKSLAEAGVAT